MAASAPPRRSSRKRRRHVAPARSISCLSKDGYSARLVVAPARRGINSIAVFLAKDGEGPFDPAELSLEIANPAAGIEAFTREPTRAASGEYRVERAELVAPGEWTIELRAATTPFDRVTFRTQLTIP